MPDVQWEFGEIQPRAQRSVMPNKSRGFWVNRPLNTQAADRQTSTCRFIYSESMHYGQNSTKNAAFAEGAPPQKTTFY
jgi:hypothetical protein